MILNYRIEFCRTCYWKQTKKCSTQEAYHTNTNPPRLVNGAGECLRKLDVPWQISL